MKTLCVIHQKSTIFDDRKQTVPWREFFRNGISLLGSKCKGSRDRNGTAGRICDCRIVNFSGKLIRKATAEIPDRLGNIFYCKGVYRNHKWNLTSYFILPHGQERAALDSAHGGQFLAWQIAEQVCFPQGSFLPQGVTQDHAVCSTHGLTEIFLPQEHFRSKVSVHALQGPSKLKNNNIEP
uniref:Uncharacterized protein n=1 Tax=Romanomermis culicivorax TaxID=13658 RepID=A0A915JJC5_ROMCU